MNKITENKPKSLHNELLKRSATYMFEELMKRTQIKQYIREQEKKGVTFIFEIGKDGQYWLEELKKEEK